MGVITGMCMVDGLSTYNLFLFLPHRIIFMFVYMLTMFCHLSQVNPSLQPYLKFQPWCSLCSSSDYPAAVARTTGGSTHQQAMDQQLSRFLLPTTTDTGSNRGGGDGGASASSFRSPRPSVLPTTWFVNIIEQRVDVILVFCCHFFPVFVIINIPLDCCCFIVLFLIVLTPSFCLWSLYEMWLKKKSLKICQ